MHRLSPLFAAVLAISLFAGSAQAHQPGLPIRASGSFELNPLNTFGDYREHTFSSLGFNPHSGDVLAYSWTGRNNGTAVLFFEIHSHGPPSGYEKLYSLTAGSNRGSWRVPGSDPYMMYWRNLADETVNVSYAYEYTAGEDPLLLALAVFVPIGAAGAILAVAFSGRGRKGASRDKAAAPDEPSPDSDEVPAGKS